MNISLPRWEPQSVKSHTTRKEGTLLLLDPTISLQDRAGQCSAVAPRVAILASSHELIYAPDGLVGRRAGTWQAGAQADSWAVHKALTGRRVAAGSGLPGCSCRSRPALGAPPAGQETAGQQGSMERAGRAVSGHDLQELNWSRTYSTASMHSSNSSVGTTGLLARLQGAPVSQVAGNACNSFPQQQHRQCLQATARWWSVDSQAGHLLGIARHRCSWRVCTGHTRPRRDFPG